MARNSGGTHSLPAGNPVVTGTTVSSTAQNNTLSDLSAEVTDSLCRSGKGAMLAALELADGSVATPALSFDNDTDCGLYRIGANNVGVAAAGTKVIDISSTGVSFPVGVTTAKGVTITHSTANADALTVTGNGTGKAIVAQGDLSSTGTAIYAAGGANGALGIEVWGGGTTGVAIEAHSSGTGAAGVFYGTSTSTPAINVAAGYVKISQSNPASTVGFTNSLTAMNIPKAWASVDLTNATPFVPSVAAGFNIASVSRISATVVRVTFGTALANANFAAIGVGFITTGGVPAHLAISARNTAYVEVGLSYNGTFATLDSVGGVTIQLAVFGAQ